MPTVDFRCCSVELIYCWSVAESLLHRVYILLMFLIACFLQTWFIIIKNAAYTVWDNCTIIFKIVLFLTSLVTAKRENRLPSIAHLFHRNVYKVAPEVAGRLSKSGSGINVFVCLLTYPLNAQWLWPKNLSSTSHSFWVSATSNGLPYGTIVLSACIVVYCGQMVGWIKIPLGTEVGLGPGNIVLDGHGKWHSSPFCTFWPMSIMAKRSPISATAELLLSLTAGKRKNMTVARLNQATVVWSNRVGCFIAVMQLVGIQSEERNFLITCKQSERGRGRKPSGKWSVQLKHWS